MPKTTDLPPSGPDTYRGWIVVTFLEPYPVMQYGIQAGTPKRGEDKDFAHHAPGYEIWIPDTESTRWSDFLTVYLPGLGYRYTIGMRVA